MKKITLILFFVAIAVNAYSQKVRVIDKSNLKPVINAVLTSGTTTAKSDILGYADISAFQGAEKITVTASDYITQTVSYSMISSGNFQILMSEKSYRTDEIVVSADKFQENSKFLPRQIEVLNSEDIAYSNTQTTADLLQNTGQVFVQKSQLGGGSPVLRGFEANKVLIMIDGVRFNNLIFRGGHLQNVLRIDENVLNRTEVLFGAGSTLYGSDALGGVMSFYTKDPILSLTNRSLTTGTAFYRYSSADNENTGHVNFSIANNKLGFLGGFTYSNFNALRMGANDVKNPAWLRRFIQQRGNGKDTMIATTDYFLQDPSGYNQWDILGKFLINQSPNVNHTFNFQYSNTFDIPRYDRLNTINPNTGNYTVAQWFYGPEKRMLASYKLGLRASKTIFDNSKILLAYQDINESRNSRNFQSSATSQNFGQLNLVTRDESVHVYSLNADFEKMLRNMSNSQSFHDLTYGIEGYYNTVESTADAVNVNTGAISDASTRYPDGDDYMWSFAAYVADNWRLSNKVNSNIGLRYSYVQLGASFEDTTFYKFKDLYPGGVEQKNGALSGNLGFTFLPQDAWKIYINGSSGFRAPDIDDLAKIFETVPGSGTTYGTVIVPNPDLGPEYTYNGELGVSNVFSNKLFAQAIGYYTYITDAIVTGPYTVDGKSVIIYDGDSSNVWANQNSGSGFIWGTTLNLNCDFTNYLSMTNTATYTYGRVNTDSTDQPLDHIPPLYGKSAIVVGLNKFKGEFNIMYNAWKLKKDYSASGEDNFQDATPDGMPNWFTLNTKVAYQMNNYLQIQLEINNLLDRNYRVFSSGINAAGINSVLTLRGTY